MFRSSSVSVSSVPVSVKLLLVSIYRVLQGTGLNVLVPELKPVHDMARSVSLVVSVRLTLDGWANTFNFYDAYHSSYQAITSNVYTGRGCQ